MMVSLRFTNLLANTKNEAPNPRYGKRGGCAAAVIAVGSFEHVFVTATAVYDVMSTGIMLCADCLEVSTTSGSQFF